MRKKELTKYDGPRVPNSMDRVPMAVGTRENPLEDEYSEDERKRRLEEVEKLRKNNETSPALVLFGLVGYKRSNSSNRGKKRG